MGIFLLVRTREKERKRQEGVFHLGSFPETLMRGWVGNKVKNASSLWAPTEKGVCRVCLLPAPALSPSGGCGKCSKLILLCLPLQGKPYWRATPLSTTSIAPHPCAAFRLHTTSWKVRLDKGRRVPLSASRQPYTYIFLDLWDVSQWKASNVEFLAMILLEDVLASLLKSYSGGIKWDERIIQIIFCLKM